ncbi:hypothetical protein BDA99DRAFT_531631 [Phascolomyces articulosus]|uniref:Uncharacterized protein n=1 Tax=Phascolomyces articulosus TaxID=60185 RepID=A0AAD5KCR0_9FUNG|nr:hypothetical protein BDA99DRAFT_531631 [Phascolomyces articulosus]
MVLSTITGFLACFTKTSSTSIFSFKRSGILGVFNDLLLIGYSSRNMRRDMMTIYNMNSDNQSTNKIKYIYKLSKKELENIYSSNGVLVDIILVLSMSTKILNKNIYHSKKVSLENLEILQIICIINLIDKLSESLEYLPITNNYK